MRTKPGLIQFIIIAVALISLVAATLVFLVAHKNKTNSTPASTPSSTTQRTIETTNIAPKPQYQNPFDQKTQYQNPFDAYQNPFDNLK